MTRIQKLKQSLENKKYKTDYEKFFWLKILKEELKLITNKQFCIMVKYIAGKENFSQNNVTGQYSYLLKTNHRIYIHLNPTYENMLLSQEKKFKRPLKLF